MVDRSEVSRALAKALAFKAVGKDGEAAWWAAKLVEDLECGEILFSGWREAVVIGDRGYGSQRECIEARDYEARVRAMESKGMTRSDAQSVVEAEDLRDAGAECICVSCEINGCHVSEIGGVCLACEKIDAGRAGGAR